MNEIDDEIHECIKQLCAHGDTASKRSESMAAIEQYEGARDLLPDPKTHWDAARWILAAIGDARYLSGEFEQARDALLTAMHCPDAIGNPFLHLRLGQCQFELGFEVVASNELSRAFFLADEELFLDEDPKYLAHVKSVLDEPPRGWD